MDSIQHLIEARDLAIARLKIHNLKGDKLENDLSAAIEWLQAACPHEDVEHKKSYHSGGYDYCASTDHSWVCNTCGKLLKHHTEDHFGHFG